MERGKEKDFGDIVWNYFNDDLELLDRSYECKVKDYVKTRSCLKGIIESSTSEMEYKCEVHIKYNKIDKLKCECKGFKYRGKCKHCCALCLKYV